MNFFENLWFAALTAVEIWAQLDAQNRIFEEKTSAPFFLIFFGLSVFITLLPLTAFVHLLLFTGVMFFYAYFALAKKSSDALFTSVMLCALMSCCFGAFNFLTVLLLNARAEHPAAMLITGAAPVALFLLFIPVIRGKLRFDGEIRDGHHMILFIPMAAIYAVLQLINFRFYGSVTDTRYPISVSRSAEIFIVQTLCMAGIFCLLYAYRRADAAADLKEKLAAYKTQAAFEARIAKEAQERLQAIRALRHDMKNHLLIMRGLIEKSKPDEARDYLNNLDRELSEAVPETRTNYPAVDVLLEDKAARARALGVDFECALFLPENTAISETDLCVVLSNALDNALCASESAKSKRICLKSTLHGNFLMIQTENGYAGGPILPGTGLFSIKRTAEKYAGTAEFTTQNDTFILRMLFCLSPRK